MTSPNAPFDGLKVLDLAWVVAGPLIGRTLADYGATVVRAESAKRVDTARLMGPFPGGKMDPQRSALFENCNAGKLGLSLDLASAAGQAVAHDLARWADVVVESFAPGQMDRWGLGAATLRAANPALIVLSTSLMGQTGPYRTFAGYGNLGAAVAGFQQLVGWPGEEPVGPFGPYTDYVAPRFGLVALLAALDHRRRTGEGCVLDVSQAEAGLQLLAPQMAACSLDGRLVEAQGNRDAQMAPHGVFPCLPEADGQEAWVALAVAGDTQWRRLDARLGGGTGGLDTLAARQAEEDALERRLAAWTGAHRCDDIVAWLQSDGIAAHRVAANADVCRDPQLVACGHFVRLPHPRGGESVVEGARFELSATPARCDRPAPTTGADNEHVLRALLGYDDTRIAALAAAGALT